MPVIAYIGIGSNIGDREALCLQAIELLEQAGRVEKISSLYYTEPVGYKLQDDFINAVVAISTELSPLELLSLCLSIEEKMGRKRVQRWGPRTMDLDILLYGDRVINQQDLTIPHPMMTTRKFVLAPLVEIAPDARHPELNRNMEELLRELEDSVTVVKCRCQRAP